MLGSITNTRFDSKYDLIIRDSTSKLSVAALRSSCFCLFAKPKSYFPKTFRPVIASILIILCSSAVLPSQTTIITGTVIDRETGEGLPMANIYLAGTSIGTATNSKGQFVFKIPSKRAQDTMVVSYLSYHQKRVVPDHNSAPLIIELTPDKALLPEVVVGPPDVLQLVEDAFNRVEINYDLSPHLRTGFLRDRLRSEGKYVSIREVLFEIYAKQKKRRMRLLKGRYAEDKFLRDQLQHVSVGNSQPIWGAFPYPALLLPNDPKSKRGLGYFYDFYWRESVMVDGEEVMVITFDQKDGIRKPLLSGKLFIQRSSLAFLAMDFGLSPKGRKHLRTSRFWNGDRMSRFPFKSRLHDMRIKLDYRQDDKKWYLQTARFETKMDLSHEFLWYDGGTVPVHFVSERVMTALDKEVSENRVDSALAHLVINVPDRLLEVSEENYDNGYWEGYNYLLPDIDLNEVVQSFRENNIAWEKGKMRRLLAELAKKKKRRSTRLFAEDLDYLKTVLEETHPGLLWYTTEAQWNRFFGDASAILKSIREERDFDKLISAIVAQIDCGHTRVLPAVTTEEFDKYYGKRLPFDVEFAEDGAIVRDLSCAGAVVPEALELVAIDEKTVREIAGELKNYLSSDGFNQTFKTHLLNRDFGNLFARYMDQPDKLKIAVRDSLGELYGCVVEPQLYRQIAQEVPPGAFQFWLEEQHDLAVMKITSFADDPSRGSFSGFLSEAFGQVAEREVGNLVVDLRGNPGGNDEYGALLYSYLTDRPFRYLDQLSVRTNDPDHLGKLLYDSIPLPRIVPEFIENVIPADSALLYREHPNLGSLQPQANAFSGKVYFLIDGGTFSTAAEFCAIARSNHRGIFIGRETGGGYHGNCSFGTPVAILPNTGMRIQIPLARYHLHVEPAALKGRGVMPDREVAYAVRDLWRGEDKEMLLARKLIDESLR